MSIFIIPDDILRQQQMSGAGLRIKVKKAGDNIRQLILRGVVDGHTAKTLEKAIIDVIESNICKIILDFMRVSYLGSAGIGVIIACKGKLTDRFPNQASDIVIVNPIDSVRDVFNLLEISNSISIVSTEEEAAAQLNSLE